MSDCTHLHETIIKDVLDIWDDIKNADIESLPKRKKERASFSSIARDTQNLVLTFPVACSTAMSIQSAAMIAKAIERKCVSMVQMLLASFQVTDTDNIQDFLGQFHTNLSTRDFSVDDFLALTDACIEIPGVEINREQYEAIKADMKNLDYALRGPIQAAPLSEYSIMEYGGQTMVMQEKFKFGSGKRVSISSDEYEDLTAAADRSEAYKSQLLKSGLDHANKVAGMQTQINDRDVKIGRMGAAYQNSEMRNAALNSDLNDMAADYAADVASLRAELEAEKQKAEKTGKANSKTIADLEKRIAKYDSQYGRNAIAVPDAASRKNSVDYFNKMVIGNELKKANELMPSLLAVNFTYKNSEGRPVVLQDVVIGVKAKLYIVDSYDMMDHFASKTQDANWVTQLLRATTREISFIKDFLLMLDRAKIDALSYSRRGSANKMWKVLERRALKSRMKRAFGKNNNAAAITTMVISQEEIDFIKKNFHIDLQNPALANKVLDGYNLMGLVIVDETMEVAKFLFDTGEDMWENVSFSQLEREAGDNTYKKVINMMTKVVR